MRSRTRIKSELLTYEESCYLLLIITDCAYTVRAEVINAIYIHYLPLVHAITY